VPVVTGVAPVLLVGRGAADGDQSRRASLSGGDFTVTDANGAVVRAASQGQFFQRT